jgi:integrase
MTLFPSFPGLFPEDCVNFFLGHKGGPDMPQTRRKPEPAPPLQTPETDAALSHTDKVIRDAHVPELGRRIRGKQASWVVHLSTGGKRRKVTLGDCRVIPLDQARALARDLLATPEAEDRPDPTTPLARFAEIFLAECAAQWKPATLKANQNAVRVHIVPGLGTRPIGALTRQDVIGWMAASPLSEGGRNRALSVLSALCAHAEIRGCRPPESNPCKSMRRHKSSFQALYLDAAGYAALGDALRRLGETHPREVAALRFIALTGCRRGEALSLEWPMIEGNCAALPDSKSGARSIWLGKPALRLLATCPRVGRYVFGTGDDPLPSQRVALVWETIRRDIGKPALRIHDLRHSFASVGVRLGHDLVVIGGLLGHADTATTAGYAHLDQAETQEASQRVGTHLQKVMSPAPRKRLAPRKPTVARDIFHAFVLSRDSLETFCEAHGLTPATFRRGLIKWREVQRAPGARRAAQ